MMPNKFPSLPEIIEYDFCIVGWSTYCHILDRRDRVNLLTGIKKVVSAPVLISFVGRKKSGKLKRIIRKSISFLEGLIR